MKAERVTTRHVISEDGPIITESAQKALSKVQEGNPSSEVAKQFAQDIKTGFKRNEPSTASQLVKMAVTGKVKRTFKDVLST